MYVSYVQEWSQRTPSPPPSHPSTPAWHKSFHVCNDPIDTALPLKTRSLQYSQIALSMARILPCSVFHLGASCLKDVQKSLLEVTTNCGIFLLPQMTCVNGHSKNQYEQSSCQPVHITESTNVFGNNHL